MWLQIIIVVLFFLVVVSLGSGLQFLFKDIESNKSKRTLYALGIRIVLASLLMVCIFYGLQTGTLHSSAPWDSNV